jgi:hypothetical protein
MPCMHLYAYCNNVWHPSDFSFVVFGGPIGVRHCRSMKVRNMCWWWRDDNWSVASHCRTSPRLDLLFAHHVSIIVQKAALFVSPVAAVLDSIPKQRRFHSTFLAIRLNQALLDHFSSTARMLPSITDQGEIN